MRRREDLMDLELAEAERERWRLSQKIVVLYAEIDLWNKEIARLAGARAAVSEGKE